MATIYEETAKALLTGPLQLQRIYRAIEAAHQDGYRTGFAECRARAVELCADRMQIDLGERIRYLQSRALSPSGVEAGEGFDRPTYSFNYLKEKIDGASNDGYARALADVEQELFEARSKHLTPPLVYWADIYMVLARLREGSRG